MRKFVETEKVELKRTFNDNAERDCVAFLNTDGGTIYIGVENDGKVSGVPDEKVDETYKAIMEAFTGRILPSCADQMSSESIIEDGKRIIKISIKPGKKVYYLKKYGRTPSGCFKRIGTSAVPLTEEEIDRRYLASVSYLSPSLINAPAPRQDLTFKVFKIYLDAKKVPFTDDNFDNNFSLRLEDGRYNYNAYALSDQFDASIKVAKFNGPNKLEGKFAYRKSFGPDCILKIIDDVDNYIQTNINIVRSYFDYGKTQRRDEFLLDHESVREGWINACLHNLYLNYPGPSVYLFSDHLEIFSYGNPLDRMTKESFLAGRSNPVNKQLADTFMKVDFSEESGKGINTIVKKYGSSVFEFGSFYLSVNIPYNKLAMEDVDEETGKENQAVIKENINNKSEILNQEESKVLRLIVDNPSITRGVICEKLNKSDSSIGRIIKSLKNKGIIKGKTANKNGEWVIDNSEML